jgi:hypothetical protein
MRAQIVQAKVSVPPRTGRDGAIEEIRTASTAVKLLDARIEPAALSAVS